MKQICVGVSTFTQVDDEDYVNLFNRCEWSVTKSGHVQGSFDKKHVFMHILIGSWMCFNKNKDTEHKDGNGLNNQRFNLREATRTQNHANRKINKNNKLGIKNVYKTGRKYETRIEINNIQIKLGYYQLEIEAAYAQNVAAKFLFKEFARTNEIDFESDLLPDLKKKLIEADVIARINTRFNRKEV